MEGSKLMTPQEAIHKIETSSLPSKELTAILECIRHLHQERDEARKNYCQLISHNYDRPDCTGIRTTPRAFAAKYYGPEEASRLFPEVKP